MALPVTNGLDLGQTGLIQALLHPVDADPSGPVEGQVWYRVDLDRFRVRAGNVTKTIAHTDELSSGQQTPSDLLGSILTVDGPGSGLNADLLDGKQASEFALASQLVGLASAADIDAQIAALVGSAPAALNTLDELANALGDNANFATTINNSIAQRTKKFSIDIGSESTPNFTVTHSLGTEDVVVSVRRISNKKFVLADIDVLNGNSIRVNFGDPPGDNAFRVVVIG